MNRVSFAAFAVLGVCSASADADLIYRFNGAVTTVRDDTFPSFPDVAVGDLVSLEVRIDENPTNVQGQLFAQYEVINGDLTVGNAALALSSGTANVFNGSQGLERFEVLADAGFESFRVQSTNASVPSLLDGRELPTQRELDGLDFRGTYEFTMPGSGTELFRYEFFSATVVPAPATGSLLAAAVFAIRRRRYGRGGAA